MSTGATLIITIPKKSAKHIAIWQYIEQHCDHDGRGIRTQPLIEKLFYECARSGLTPDEVCYAIRAYEAAKNQKGDAENGDVSHQGAPMKIAESPPPAAPETPSMPMRTSQNLAAKPKPDAQEETAKIIRSEPRVSDYKLPDIEIEGLIGNVTKPKQGGT